MESLANQLADLTASAGPQLDDILRLESTIPYSKFINDFRSICINLNSLCQSLKPEFDKLALVPKPTLPLNPTTKQPDRIIVAELLNIAPSTTSEDYKKHLKNIFEEKFKEELKANLDADFSLAKLVLDHNEHIFQVMATSEEFTKPSKPITVQQSNSNVDEYLKKLYEASKC
ncbi:hypothetical protein BmR1_04g09815 [Babesia microti strain RI]|uniref:Mediator of RNA polymerase II transcription subunit 8 n=1 Tax=Babesia microti (strain RI) TaxID=1133968 RepID=I7JE17_BABMR|nr:hypothetical protein BmR1_04g09815 [Babesia microti strain RI]CCF76130.1 hypothetical protein BmR1_04g09815 [Babesia microti strain RI]|eukprot:XP_012650538.1 hypothetical protein BmR1_04g09815 [Babesia microti strain RI]